jgi:hypothetical protein
MKRLEESVSWKFRVLLSFMSRWEELHDTPNRTKSQEIQLKSITLTLRRLKL